jgi:hypothetical protein
MEIRRKGECNPTIDQNSTDLSDPRGVLGTSAEGATYVLHKFA